MPGVRFTGQGWCSRGHPRDVSAAVPSRVAGHGQRGDHGCQHCLGLARSCAPTAVVRGAGGVRQCSSENWGWGLGRWEELFWVCCGSVPVAHQQAGLGCCLVPGWEGARSGETSWLGSTAGPRGGGGSCGPAERGTAPALGRGRPLGWRGQEETLSKCQLRKEEYP